MTEILPTGCPIIDTKRRVWAERPLAGLLALVRAQREARESSHGMASRVRNLTAWARHCGYEPALHHRLLINQLERVASGEIDRLAIFMPPGSAKSTYGSILFPPWCMASRPGFQVLGASHTTELANRWGRKIRGIVEEHSAILGCSLSPVSNAAGRWQLSNGAEYFAAGVGTGIAGFRADLAVIDDPLRLREDADSDTVSIAH